MKSRLRCEHWTVNHRHTITGEIRGGFADYRIPLLPSGPAIDIPGEIQMKETTLQS